TVRKITSEMAVFDDVSTLRGNPFVVVCESSQTGTVFETCVGDDIYNVRTVFQLVQLIERQKTCPCEIRFLTENPVKFDRMADRFVNLQAELASVEEKRSSFLGALCCRVQRDRLLGHARSVPQQFKGLDQFISCQCVLTAKTIRVGALLNF